MLALTRGPRCDAAALVLARAIATLPPRSRELCGNFARRVRACPTLREVAQRCRPIPWRDHLTPVNHPMTQRFVSRVLACTALVVITAVAAAQSAPSSVDGRWMVRFERRVPATHLRAATTEARAATLSLRLRGDSVFGTWQPLADSAMTPLAEGDVRGSMRSGALQLFVEPRIPNEESWAAAAMRTVSDSLRSWLHGARPMGAALTLSVRGDSLVGTMRAESRDGTVVGRVTPIAAVRVR